MTVLLYLTGLCFLKPVCQLLSDGHAEHTSSQKSGHVLLISLFFFRSHHYWLVYCHSRIKEYLWSKKCETSCASFPFVQCAVSSASTKSPSRSWLYLLPLVFVLVAQRFAQNLPEKVVPLPFLSHVFLVWFEFHTFSGCTATSRPYLVCLSLQDFCRKTHGDTEATISHGLKEQSVFVSGKKRLKLKKG